MGWPNWGCHLSLGIFSGLSTIYFSSLYNLTLSAYVFFKINSGHLVLCIAITPLRPKWVWAKLNNNVNIINPYPFLTPMYNNKMGPTLLWEGGGGNSDLFFNISSSLVNVRLHNEY